MPKKETTKKKKEEKVKEKKTTKKVEEVKKIEEVKEGKKIGEKDKEKELESEKEVIKKEKPKTLKKGFISGLGRRKTSVARVFLWESKGDFFVNDLKIQEYFSGEIDKTKWEKPFHAVGISHPEAKFSASIKVSGSGKPSQMDAVILGISRALSKVDAEFDKALRKQGFLTRDSRMVERKKPFLHKARKRPQYSKR